MFCPNCGVRVDDNAAFCPNCGNPLDHARAQQTERLAYAAASETVPELAPTPPGQTQEYPAGVPAGYPVPPSPRPNAQADSQALQNPQSAPGFTAPYAPVAAQSAPASVAPVATAQAPKKPSKLPIVLAVVLIAALAVALLAVFFGDEGFGGATARASLGEYSWDELSEISEKISACSDQSEAMRVAKRYNLVNSEGRIDGGQTKDVVLTDGTATTATLVGVYHDTRSVGGNRAGLTFMITDPIAMAPMNTTPANNGGWRDSAMRSYAAGDLERLLPSELRMCLVHVAKQTNNEGGMATGLASVTTTDDELWLFSVSEVCGPVTWRSNESSNLILSSEGEQYQLFKTLGVDSNGDNAFLVKSYDDKPVRWWTRSPRMEYIDDFNYVNDAGGPHFGDDADEEYGVVVGFCI